MRVSSFAYESPADLAQQLGGTDLLMCCSDYPHSEGTATPLTDYAAGGLDARSGTAPGLFSDNIAFLLRKTLTAAALDQYSQGCSLFGCWLLRLPNSQWPNSQQPNSEQP